MENVAKNLDDAIASVPPGPWAVGVSGGADSVALLTLLHQRPDLQLHVVHLDHETRQGASAQDAAFVKSLAERWGLPVTVKRKSKLRIKPTPRNVPAAYRRARLALFRHVVRQCHLQGVILAHHRDDQAETVFQSLLRGSGPVGLRGIRPVSKLRDLIVLHPLLNISRAALVRLLKDRKMDWREDASNALPISTRNRVRKVLAAAPELTQAMIDLCEASRRLCQVLNVAAPRLGERFKVAALRGVPGPLARHALRRWLVQNHGDRKSINADTLNRLMAMVEDAASPARQDCPGGLTVRRRAGEIFVDRSPPRP